TTQDEVELVQPRVPPLGTRAFDLRQPRRPCAFAGRPRRPASAPPSATRLPRRRLVDQRVPRLARRAPPRPPRALVPAFGAVEDGLEFRHGGWYTGERVRIRGECGVSGPRC